MGTPYIGFSNETLAKQPALKTGDTVTCPRCGSAHVVAGSDGSKLPPLLFYACEGKQYLAGVNGRSVMGVPSDVSGTVG